MLSLYDWCVERHWKNSAIYTNENVWMGDSGDGTEFDRIFAEQPHTYMDVFLVGNSYALSVVSSSESIHMGFQLYIPRATCLQVIMWPCLRVEPTSVLPSKALLMLYNVRPSHWSCEHGFASLAASPNRRSLAGHEAVLDSMWALPL